VSWKDALDDINYAHDGLKALKLTLDVEMTWPVSNHMGNLALPSLMEARVIHNTLANGRSI
jgi:hypothetical protein